MDIVIAKFKEDVSWISRLSDHNVIVYNKDPEDKTWKNNRVNYGKDVETHLSYIIDHYDSLSDYTCFLQGNPFEHWTTTIEDIDNFNYKDSFLPLGPVYERDQKWYVEECINFCKKFKISFTEPFYYIGGMQIILSKEQIQSNSKQFYKEVHSNIPKIISRDNSSANNSNIIWWLEYTWPTFFKLNKQIKKYL